MLCAPGNPGIAEDVETAPVATSDFDGLVDLARSCDLAVVGPEDPLVNGLADRFRAEGIATFGPGADGARLEASKAFSKQLMEDARVRTARFQTFTELGPARLFAARLCEPGRGVVVKASGNAVGKGAFVCDSVEEAYEALDGLLIQRSLGDAGRVVVVEERLQGPEFSLLTLVSGTNYRSLPIAQDYKRAHDGGIGPNTGGMGSYSPVVSIDESVALDAEARVVEPILRALKRDGIDFRGVLFSGLLVQGGIPYCLEYNVRFGDPETQSILCRLGNGLFEALLACARGLLIPAVEVTDRAAVTVVVASRGYPNAPEKGFPVELPLDPPAKIFHAGTALKDGVLVNSGGRVFSVTGAGPTVEEARKQAYVTADAIRFEGAWRRSDIGLVEKP